MIEKEVVWGIILFASAFGGLLAGFPVAPTLAGCAIFVGLVAMPFGAFDFGILSAFPQRAYGVLSNETFIAVPLFVFMGTILERSGIAEELLETMTAAMGRLPAGMAVSVTLVGALLAASTGIVGATVVTMGMMALPTMIKNGYEPGFAAGSVCASGTLGQIIPPSIILILLGDVMSTAYQEAQLSKGIFSPETLTVGDLFAGAFIPGLTLVALLVLYQLAYGMFSQKKPARTISSVSVSRLLKSLVAPLALIVAVLGSILFGVATATESAGLGAVGAILLAAGKFNRTGVSAASWGTAFIALGVIVASVFDIRLSSTASWASSGAMVAVMLILVGLFALALSVAMWVLHQSGILVAAARSAIEISGVIFFIVLCAAIFSLSFRGLHSEHAVRELLMNLGGNGNTAVLAVIAVVFLLGFFLDFVEIIFIVLPIVAPIILAMDVDPVWFSVLVALVLQTSFLTPPFGFALFYLKGVAPPELTTAALYRGVVPFIILQLVGLLMVAAVPEIATALPNLLYK